MGPIFFGYLFLVIKDVNFVSYASDNTIYQSRKNVDDVISVLQLSTEKVSRWFTKNRMKGNTGRLFFILGTTNTPENQVEEALFKTSNCENLLCIKIDYKLTFDNCVDTLCKKVNVK